MSDHLGLTVSNIEKSKEFWIGDRTPNNPPIHVAFQVSSRAQVDSFYTAIIVAGGRDNGAPDISPHYHSNYYCAFILDFDGHNIEIVCHAPTSLFL